MFTSPGTQPGAARTEPLPRPLELEGAVGYRFTRPELLKLALTHPSAAEGTDQHYERLEFLGDAVLDLAIADLLMRHFPEGKEGLLSRQRASIVNARTLAAKAESIGLGKCLRLGKGEEKSGGRQKTSILAAGFEALLGAIYSDSGLAEAQQVVERLFGDDIGGPAAERDYKTELQEAAHRYFRTHPVYEVVSESGPDHAKRFVTRIRIGARQLGVGEGSSKKLAEQAAASEALSVINAEQAAGRGGADGQRRR
ncbi:MAG TPA: ribonuclease III [Candidatus Binataceae bacterium]|nr:ribonuclease III [Candidatus Binataceae bacterium]